MMQGLGSIHPSLIHLFSFCSLSPSLAKQDICHGMWWMNLNMLTTFVKIYIDPTMNFLNFSIMWMTGLAYKTSWMNSTYVKFSYEMWYKYPLCLLYGFGQRSLESQDHGKWCLPTLLLTCLLHWYFVLCTRSNSSHQWLTTTITLCMAHTNHFDELVVLMNRWHISSLDLPSPFMKLVLYYLSRAKVWQLCCFLDWAELLHCGPSHSCDYDLFDIIVLLSWIFSGGSC